MTYQNRVPACRACYKNPCQCMASNGKKKPADDDCDHDFDEDEDAQDYVCVHCGYREPIPLDRIMRE